ncbi:helicase-related protein, partial [Porticoccus sp.]|nr:helicase-related protein [Porticoccus sp.]
MSLTQSKLAIIQKKITGALSIDRHQLTQEFKNIRSHKKIGKLADRQLDGFIKRLNRSCQKRDARLSAIPFVQYQNNLPIAERRDEIKKAILDNQVIIIAGETGSGKTTQLPKICLELGRGSNGIIGHTQPRRIAARAVAVRIAEELGQTIGQAVGYQVRFRDESNPNTLIKLMTDGILLAEVQHDPYFSKYDTIIIDEAHERSLNIDFLLGYLKTILPKRPDLKLIITSATIDIEKFSKHFNGAPVIKVLGRTYPVEVQYIQPEQDMNLSELILEAIKRIISLPERGDILVFHSGEREIRETANKLLNAQLNHLDIVPLYSRLSLSEQSKVFSPHKGIRVVLSTNVAETSLTVPGIRYVIDPGMARISRYSFRTKVQRLPIEPISQASANQRKGRCGRLSNGVCFRLYTEDDFNSRDIYTDPEIV